MFHSPNPPTKTTLLVDDNQTLFSPVLVELLRRVVDRTQSAASEHEISLPDIIKIAAARFINSSDHHDDTSIISLLVPSNNKEVTKQVELVNCLLNAAEEIDRCKYDQSICSLDICDSLSSMTGNLTQRVVYYFAQALRRRVYNESGVVNIWSLVDELEKHNIEEVVTAPCPIVGILHEKVPFYQVGQLAGVQAIVESVEKSKRIHIIDLKIRNGMQWAALMQALVTRSKRDVEMLKITAVVTSYKNLIHETGERLSKLAKSMNIPFSFKAVAVPNLLEIDQKQFDLDPKEAVRRSSVPLWCIL
ncbi:DELLA protein RGL2 [Linum grandiflorum]